MAQIKKTDVLVDKNINNPSSKRPDGLVFGKINYIIMIIGCVVSALGFILMIGGESKDPNVFNMEIFNFQRLTLAPILILGGYGIALFSIMKKAKD